MASSFQEAPASPPPSDPRWKHDVFLSFRGPDTRKGITTNLYERLQRRGIKTFMDEEDLQVGHVIKTTLLAAIRESRFAIVVLSQNYASSTWCLEELREICLCMEDDSRILPLFYQVDPTDVRYQKRSFKDAFTKHVNSGRHKPEKVKEWEDALEKVANISGWSTNDSKTRTESDLVNLIVEYVCREVLPAAIEPMEELEEFQATRKAMDEVMNALNNDEISAVGVYGMGGVGKTTMVNHVGAQARRIGIFHHVVMAVVSQTPNFVDLQDALAEQLGIKLDEKSKIARSARLNKVIMRKEKLLIILDDVWGRTELSEIGIPSYNNLQKSKSKVLLTTRRLNVCHTMECQANIHLNILSKEDAWSLFSKKARKSFEESTDFYKVARKVARECSGLPIALIAVARALGDKDFEDWNEAAQRLEMSQPVNLDEEKDVFECIKLSYDYLNSDEARSCFLLCGLFPEDYDIPVEDLLKYGFGTGLFRDVNSTIGNARVRAKSVAKYLKASCLLLESAEEGCVKMHDVIRDMAIRIAQSVDYPAVSRISNCNCKLPNRPVCSKLKILVLHTPFIREIPHTFFQSPNDLRLLDIRGMDISSLPTSLGLLTNLQALCLDFCGGHSMDISVLGKLKKLEILSMKLCFIEELPKEMGDLTNLRMLDLTGTSFVTVSSSQVISRLHRLEELYMRYSHCYRDSGVEVGLLRFDELAGLSCLNTLEVSVSGVHCLPQTVEFNPSWVHFNICISRSAHAWRNLEDYFLSADAKFLSPSRALTIETTMNDLPDWFINVVTEKTEALWYHRCLGLTNLLEEYDRGRLHGLKYLFIDFSHARVLLNPIEWPRGSTEPVFEHLEELRIRDADRLKELCFGEIPPGSLRSLKILNMQSCWNLKSCSRLVEPLLPSKLLHRLKSLEKLACDDMKYLQYLFGSEGHEPQHLVSTKLRIISLRQLYNLRRIWNGPAPPGIFCSLKIIHLFNCWELQYVFTSDVARGLLQLEDLWVASCDSLDRIVEASEETESNKFVLPHLKNLVLDGLPMLTRFCSTSSSTIDIEIECPSLEHLLVDECPQFSVSASDFNSSNQVQLIGHQQWLTLQERIYYEIKFSHFSHNIRKETRPKTQKSKMASLDREEEEEEEEQQQGLITRIVQKAKGVFVMILLITWLLLGSGILKLS